MTLLEEENQKWYCHKDDELYYAKENHWGALPDPHAPTFDSKGVATNFTIGGLIGAALAVQRNKKNAQKNAEKSNLRPIIRSNGRTLFACPDANPSPPATISLRPQQRDCGRASSLM